MGKKVEGGGYGGRRIGGGVFNNSLIYSKRF